MDSPLVETAVNTRPRMPKGASPMIQRTTWDTASEMFCREALRFGEAKALNASPSITAHASDGSTATLVNRGGAATFQAGHISPYTWTPVFEAPEGTDVPALLQALPSVEKAETDEDGRSCIVTAIPDASARNEIFALCVENKWQLTEITGIETSLEDVFRMLTTQS